MEEQVAKFISQRQAAKQAGFPLRALRTLCNRGQIPPPVKVGNQMYFERTAFFQALDRITGLEAAKI